MTTPVWISLGSNLGDRRTILDQALALLDQAPGVVVSTVSSYHQTRPVGGPAGQGLFLNAAARLETSLAPRELLAVTQTIEHQLGRVRVVRWSERTLDIDLLMYGCKFVDEPDLKLPHPRLPLRRFVLAPLVEIAPDLVEMITGSQVSTLLRDLDTRPGIVMVDESIWQPAPQILDLLVTSLSARMIGEPSIEAKPMLERAQIAELQAALACRERDLINLIDSRHKRADPDWLVANFAIDLRTSTMRFIVASPRSKWARKPGRCRTPILWPEATDPAAIVAEVVAVCRGIAEGSRDEGGQRGPDLSRPL